MWNRIFSKQDVVYIGRDVLGISSQNLQTVKLIYNLALELPVPTKCNYRKEAGKPPLLK
jgi:hypothetical protein